jgi:hypothetical protein
MSTTATARQLNLRIEASLYQAIEALALEERRSVPQAAKVLLEQGLISRLHAPADDIPGQELALIADHGGAFDWLKDEPDLYDDTMGEPV